MVRESIEKIGTTSTISVALVITLMSLAFFCGSVYHRVETLDSKQANLEQIAVDLKKLVESHENRLARVEFKVNP